MHQNLFSDNQTAILNRFEAAIQPIGNASEIGAALN